jgi:hypothetical protein
LLPDDLLVLLLLVALVLLLLRLRARTDEVWKGAVEAVRPTPKAALRHIVRTQKISAGTAPKCCNRGL